MPRIRCTHKLLKFLGKEATAAARNDASNESDLDWYANLFYVEGRKCLIFTNVGTLASFVSLDVLKKDVADLPSFFRGRYRDFLGSIRATARQIEHELEFYQNLELGKSSNRKVLGTMTTRLNELHYEIGMAGGLAHADETDLSTWLSSTLTGQPPVVPVEELAKRIPGIRTSFDPSWVEGRPLFNALMEFMRTSDTTLGKLGYYGLRGFFFAVLTAPAVVMPSKWMEVLFDGDQAGFRNEEHARQVTELIRKEYDRVNRTILDGAGVRPHQCPVRDNALANFDPGAPVRQWSRGFTLGFDWLSDSWARAFGEATFEKLIEIASDLMFFASREAAVEILERSGKSAEDLDDYAEDVRDDFYHTAASITRLGRAAQRPMGDGGLVLG